MSPSTSVTLHREQLDQAIADGLLTAEQGAALWARLADPVAAVPPDGSAPKFGFVTVLYYFGGMLAIGAMSLFMTLTWASFGSAGLLALAAAYLFGCLKVADNLNARVLPIPAGILATLAVVLVPLVVWCIQHLLGLWPPGGSDRYASYHTLIDWRWLTLEFSALLAGVVMLWRYRHPFMMMPIAVTLWYLSMDVAHALMQGQGTAWAWQFMRDVSLLFGIATLCIAVWVDVRCRAARASSGWHRDFAFWLYLFGTLMFWGGLSLQDSGSEIGKFLYCLINLALVFGGAALGRRVFTVFGGIGVALYLGHLSYRVFGNSLLFPVALSLLGLAVIALGIWWQRHETVIQQQISRWLPRALQGPPPG